MKLITHHIHGRLSGSTLQLQDTAPAEKTAVSLYLRYALIIRGPENHIFPAFALDDWGTEIRGLKLYRWLRENGDRFPRGEIFGVDANGRETQEFIRDLELHFKLPCYAYAKPIAPVTDGAALEMIQLPDGAKRPSYPLRAARVTWSNEFAPINRKKS